MNKRRARIGILLIIIVILGLFSIYKYLNFSYNTYYNSTLNIKGNNSAIGQLENLISGEKWKKPIDEMGNLKQYYDEAHKVNPGVIGWIFVDGTNINYPIEHGKPDDYYLTHNWKGEPYWNGSIFLDHANSGFDNVSLINGHNMLNGIMFSQLMNFKNKEFFDANHKIYIYEGAENKLATYQVIGALYCQPDISLQLGNLSEDQMKAEVSKLLSKSMYGMKPYNGGKVLLLNTCLSNGTGEHILVVAEQIN